MASYVYYYNQYSTQCVATAGKVNISMMLVSFRSKVTFLKYFSSTHTYPIGFAIIYTTLVLIVDEVL